MRASHLRIASAPIPFRSAFGHASATRNVAENVLVYARDADGRFGLGEGCPRAYVTGETQETARAFLSGVLEPLGELAGLDELEQWVADHAGEIDANPSAFCAVELALLDLFARQREQSIEELLGIEPLTRPLVTSAVYGTGSLLKFAAQVSLFRWNGMRDAKLKLTGRGSADARRAAILALGGRVRLDANNLWKDVDCAVKELAPIARHAWAVEEPVQPRAWRGMAEIAARTGLDIIVDEGFTQRRDLDAMPADPKFIPNFRVSKLGGLLRSLDAARHAVAGGRRIIVGSQVGETSILARAGIALAAFVGASLLAYEGAYGVRLLEWDVTTPTLGFGGGGRVEVATARSGRTGLGLQPSAGFPLE